MKIYLKIFILNVFIFILLYVAFPIGFEANDDAVMLMISSGIFSGIPDEHIVFSNFIYGSVLKGLYHLTDKIQWYSVLQVLIQIVSVSIFQFFLLKKFQLKNSLFLCGFIWIVISWFIISPSFTSTAFLVSSAAFIFLIESEKNKLNLLIFLTLSVLGICIRDIVYLYCGVIFSPIIFAKFFSKKQWNYVIAGVSAVILCISLWFLNTTYYKKTGYKEYLEFNAVRSQLQDNPQMANISSKNLEELTNLGISRNDILTIKDFFFDESIFDSNKLRLIKEVLNKNSRNRPSELVNVVIVEIEKYKDLLIVILIIGTCVIFKFIDNRGVILVCGFLVFVTFVIISINFHLKLRVGWGAVMVLTMILTFNFKLENILKSRAAFVLIGLMFLLSLYYSYRTYNGMRKNFKANQQMPYKIKLLSPDNLYVIRAGISFDNISPFFEFDLFRNVKFIFNGWMVNNPLNKRKLDDFAHNSNGMFSNFLINESIKIVYQNDILDFESRMKSYYKENYKLDIRIDSKVMGLTNYSYKVLTLYDITRKEKAILNLPVSN